MKVLLTIHVLKTIYDKIIKTLIIIAYGKTNAIKYRYKKWYHLF